MEASSSASFVLQAGFWSSYTVVPIVLHFDKVKPPPPEPEFFIRLSWTGNTPRYLVYRDASSMNCSNVLGSAPVGRTEGHEWIDPHPDPNVGELFCYQVVGTMPGR